MKSPALFIRAYFTKDSGYGHVYRCLSLIERALREGWQACVITDNHLSNVPLTDPNLQWFCINSEPKSETDDARQCRDILDKNDIRPALCIVDHYHLSKNWEEIIHSVVTIAAIDDLCRSHHSATWVIDSFPDRKPEEYHQPVERLLLGQKYFLMRLNFIESDTIDNIPHGDILVHFGGGAKDTYDIPILKALHNNSKLSGKVTWLQGNQAELSFWKREDLSVNVLPSCNNMALLYRNHKVVLGAAGVSQWERMAVRVASLVWCVADNQQDNFSWLTQHSANYAIEGVPDQSQFNWMSRLTKIMSNPPLLNSEIDTVGANRVWRKICPNEWLLTNRIHIQPYSEALVSELLVLQKKPGIRQFSRNAEAPTAEQHKRWSDALLSSEVEHGWLLSVPNGKSIGWLKLGSVEQFGYREVSLLVDPAFQAMGVGGSILAFAKQQTNKLSAFVDQRNSASNRIFQQCGFKQNGEWFYWEESA